MDDLDKNKLFLEGFREGLQWVKDQLFSHDHNMAMGEFHHASLALIDAKLQWIRSHKYFEDDQYDTPHKIPVKSFVE